MSTGTPILSPTGTLVLSPTDIVAFHAVVTGPPPPDQEVPQGFWIIQGTQSNAYYVIGDDNPERIERRRRQWAADVAYWNDKYRQFQTLPEADNYQFTVVHTPWVFFDDDTGEYTMGYYPLHDSSGWPSGVRLVTLDAQRRDDIYLGYHEATEAHWRAALGNPAEIPFFTVFYWRQGGLARVNVHDGANEWVEQVPHGWFATYTMQAWLGDMAWQLQNVYDMITSPP